MSVAFAALRSSDGDRWTIWPLVATTAATAALTFLCGLPGVISFVLIPLSLLVYAVTALAIVVSVIVLAARRRLRKSSCALLALIAPILLWSPIQQIGIYLHLALTVAFGAGTIGPTPNPRAAFAVYDWSVGFAGGPTTVLIRDETDEIALPLAAHKQPAARENGFGDECAGKSHRLIGHYYLCTF